MKQIMIVFFVAVLSVAVFSQLRDSGLSIVVPIADSPDLTIDGKRVRSVFRFTSGRVIDGDSIQLESEAGKLDIRLASIDAPELRQPFGDQAKRHLEQMVGQQTVTVWDIGTDRYDRTLAFLFIELADGGLFEINSQMIQDGYAWHAVRHSNNSILASLESQARRARVGLWSDASQPVPPWDFRSRGQ